MTSDDVLIQEEQEIRDRLQRIMSEQVPDTMNTRPMDYELRDKRLAERGVEEQVGEPLEDLNGNPIDGEHHETDPRGEGRIDPSWEPPSRLPSLRIAAYGLHLSEPTKAYHTAIMAGSGDEAKGLRALILATSEALNMPVEELLAESLKIGLTAFWVQAEEDQS